MSIRQELLSFIGHIGSVDAGYESWGKVTIQRIAIRDGHEILSTPLGISLATLTDVDLKKATNCEEDKAITAIFAHRPQINCILITHQEYASAVREEIPPILDDQAQLLGVSVKVAEMNKSDAIKHVLRALRSRFAAICDDGRCICLGGTVDDAYIAAQLLEKTSKAWTEAKYLGGAKSINRFEAWAMQMYFQFKYAKEAKKNR
jgi:ribulose-5-phosphate 4-epimerase/fuculose-1-phosphate aldolase